jgi:molybdate transport system permease protein
MTELETLWNAIGAPLKLTVKAGAMALSLNIILGLPLAFFLARSQKWYAVVVNWLVYLPQLLPPIATGYLLLVFLGRRSFAGSFLLEFSISFIFSFYGVVLAWFIAALPIFVKPIQSAIEGTSDSLLEASMLMGRSRLQSEIFITLPLILSSLRTGILLSAARGLGEVGITLLLGGNIEGETETLSLAIYNAILEGDENLAMGITLVLVLFPLLLSLGQFLKKGIFRRDRAMLFWR